MAWPSRKSLRSTLVTFAVVGAVWLAIRSQEEVLICDTTTSGVYVELHRNRLVGTGSAVVLMEPGTGLLPEAPSRFEVETREQAQMFGTALASPGEPAVDVFSLEFREKHCIRR